MYNYWRPTKVDSPIVWNLYTNDARKGKIASLHCMKHVPCVFSENRCLGVKTIKLHKIEMIITLIRPEKTFN